ncbi:protoglobin domain-containing protein [uncultured Devosia sp.]|uniref:protoglobin domain-containing protein n=1 Tax=uncultured Devosia sp. TaxID=211434 RepID=UPI002607B2A1|nr:protoglobin domain-containing protein [uncultured Devosia sp.]
MQETLQQRLDFLGLGADVEARLAPLSALIEPQVEQALQRFQAQLATTPSAARFLYGRDRIEANGDGLAEHWRALASGRFDRQFAEAATRMGQRHARIGLEPRWHVGSYASLVDSLVRGMLQAGMVSVLKTRRPALRLFGGADDSRMVQAVDALADGLVALLCGILLDIDLSMSGYLGKLREEGLNAVEAQRQRLRATISKAGRMLELAAEGQRDPDAAAAMDPELAPIQEGAGRLADKVLTLIADLESASAATRHIAGRAVEGGRAMLSGQDERVAAATALAEALVAANELAQDTGVTAELERRVRTQSRQRGGAKKSAAGAAQALSALQAELETLAALAEQVEGLQLNVQLATAQEGGGALQALGAGLTGLAGQLHGVRTRLDHQSQVLDRAMTRLSATVEGADSTSDVVGLLRTQGAALADAALAAEQLRHDLTGDLAQRQAAMAGLREALEGAEALADLAAAFAPDCADEVDAAPCLVQDQAALAAHWHVG